MQGEETDRDQFIEHCLKELGYEHYERMVWAYQFYKMVHAEQMRKDGKRYVTHPRGVVEIFLEFGSLTPEEFQGGLLHDTIEDGYLLPGMIEAMFGPRIANAIVILSEKRIVLREKGYIEKIPIPDEVYYPQIAQADHFVRRIKLADRLYNLRDMASLPADNKRRKAIQTRQWVIPFAHHTDERLAQAIEDQLRSIEASL